jgi:hypothetical protein
MINAKAVQETLIVVAQDNQLRLTEIICNPVEDDDLEFMGLKNASETELSLASVSVVERVSFTFPPNTLPLGRANLPCW